MDLLAGTEEHIEACALALCDSSLGAQYFPTLDSARAAVREFLLQGHFLVGFERGRLIGFICYMPHGAFHAFPYLHLFVLCAAERGRGLGACLIGLFEARIFARHDKLFLVVSDANPSARRFYARMGYREIGRIPSLYRTGIDEWLLMKTKEHGPA